MTTPRLTALYYITSPWKEVTVLERVLGAGTQPDQLARSGVLTLTATYDEEGSINKFWRWTDREHSTANEANSGNSVVEMVYSASTKQNLGIDITHGDGHPAKLRNVLRQGDFAVPLVGPISPGEYTTSYRYIRDAHTADETTPQLSQPLTAHHADQFGSFDQSQDPHPSETLTSGPYADQVCVPVLVGYCDWAHTLTKGEATELAGMSSV